ncbi:hypothetical protein [Raineyella fluvialis]|uniref:Cellulose synthase n=1 Tax=Raineyella fluvialis TaxID=2662261 RepID=A0A5Q2FGF2_9ACTN|nr:hypothetical protein [Raineyella fluvialis]QGF24877.1 hypothetical protein Rai3103_16020 [Raineyella fluvialis]
MNPSNVLLVATLALALIGLVFALVSWRAGYGAGRVLEGFGLVALSAGLFLSGLMQLAYDLVSALISWGLALVWTPLVASGISALGLAIVLWLIAGALNRRGIGVRTKEDKRARREERRARRSGQGQVTPRTGAGQVTKPNDPAATRTTAAKQPAAKGSGTAGSGDEFDEIDDILRKHGIN